MANLYEFPNVTGGPDNLLIGIANEVPVFPVMTLFFVFFVVFFSGITAQSRSRGYVDGAQWFVIAMLSVDLIALIMSLAGNLIIVEVLGFCIGLTILGGIWLFLTRGRFEQ